MKKRCKKVLIKLLAIVCSAMLLFLSPCARYLDAKSVDKVSAIAIAPALGRKAAGAALEFLIAVLASYAAGEIVIEHPEFILSPFALYVSNNYGDSIEDTCMNIYNKATGTIESISWGELIDSLSDVHDFTVDNLTDLYAQYCPALLESFEDFITDIFSGDVYISGLSDMLIDIEAVTEDSIKAQHTFETYDYMAYFSHSHIYNNHYATQTFANMHLYFAGPVACYYYANGGFNTIGLDSFGNIKNVTFSGGTYVSTWDDDISIINDYGWGGAAGICSLDSPSDSLSVDFPIFSSHEAAKTYLRTGAGYENALNYNKAMESVIDLTKVPDLAPDIPPFTRSWQQKEWERIANAPDIIGIGSYGNGVYDDNWGDDIPWIGLESLREYSRSLLDIYNQIIDDIINGTYDSSEDIPGTYSEAWEKAISEAWDNVEQSTDAVPGENEKDKSTEGDDEEKEDPEGGGGDSGDANNEDNNNQEEPPEGEDGNPKDNNQFAGKSYEGTRNSDADFINKYGESTLEEHASNHGYTSSEEYLNDARNFLEKQPTPSTQSFVSDEGTYFRYDLETNEFGIINQFGGISTYFKPEAGILYWLDQIEKYAPK